MDTEHTVAGEDPLTPIFKEMRIRKTGQIGEVIGHSGTTVMLQLPSGATLSLDRAEVGRLD